MDTSTILQLNQLNAQFYAQVADAFDDSRQYFWQGWEECAAFIADGADKRLVVSDVGCGNARFYHFLKQKFPDIEIKYHGTDTSQSLLDFATEALPKTKSVSLTNSDIITSLLEKDESDENGKFDVSVSFGVTHHIPSFDLRKKFVQHLATQTKPAGLIIISFWQFLDQGLAKKIVPPATIAVDPQQLEENDYILDWQRDSTGYRYCHYSDDQEIHQLIEDSNTKLLHSFQADGKNHKGNHYVILEKCK